MTFETHCFQITRFVNSSTSKNFFIYFHREIKIHVDVMTVRVFVFDLIIPIGVTILGRVTITFIFRRGKIF